MSLAESAVQNSGQWPVVGGCQWSVVSGQWSVTSGNRSGRGFTGHRSL